MVTFASDRMSNCINLSSAAPIYHNFWRHKFSFICLMILSWWRRDIKTHYWPLLGATGDLCFPHETCNEELRWLICCWFEQSVQQTVKLGRHDAYMASWSQCDITVFDNHYVYVDASPLAGSGNISLKFLCALMISNVSYLYSGIFLSGRIHFAVFLAFKITFVHLSHIKFEHWIIASNIELSFH